MNPISRN